jgi:uncharacterized protein DUF3617
MLRYGRRIAAIAAACVLAVSTNAGAIDMKEGLWEITTRMEMPGMPAGTGSHTVQHCVTKQDAEDPRRTLPKDDRCTIGDYKTSGNTVTWTMQCRGETEMTGTGSMTYHGSSYDGTTTMQMKHGGQTMAMTQQIAGRYIGPCR